MFHVSKHVYILPPLPASQPCPSLPLSPTSFASACVLAKLAFSPAPLPPRFQSVRTGNGTLRVSSFVSGSL
ncbi:hypothetical protein Bpfe_014307, partial [Biomphalaria pfeifferi]